MKRTMTIVTLCCVSVLASPAQPALTDSTLLRSNYAFVEQQEAWLTSENAAGLTRLSTVSHLSDARLSLCHDWGKFCDYYQSPRSLSFDATVASYYRLNTQTVLYGSITYNNFSGNDMAGSAFIDPTRQPFDIVEDSLSNLGTKHRDTYHLTGAFGSQVADWLSVGIKADYRTANYAKYKDLRHKNSLMDLTLTAGVSTRLGPVQAGADFYYRRNSESLHFATYGKADKVYKSLIDYAAFLGQTETFGDNGYTNKSREMPLLSEYTGAGLQVSWDINRCWSWFNELTYRHRSGYYGKRSPYTISYNEHTSHVYGYHGRLAFHPSTKAVHYLDVGVETENLENSANSYREVTDDNNSATNYEYYRSVKMANRLWTTGHATYTAHWNMRELTPTWTLTAAFDVAATRQTGYVYPYFRRQELCHRHYALGLQRNVFFTENILTAAIGLHYQNGSGEPFTDGTLATPSDKQTPPPSMDDYLHRHHEYLTARCTAADATLRYAHALPTLRMKPYVELHYQICRASHVVWQEGSLRQQLVISLGTTF